MFEPAPTAGNTRARRLALKWSDNRVPVPSTAFVRAIAASVVGMTRIVAHILLNYEYWVRSCFSLDGVRSQYRSFKVILRVYPGARRTGASQLARLPEANEINHLVLKANSIGSGLAFCLKTQ